MTLLTVKNLSAQPDPVRCSLGLDWTRPIPQAGEVIPDFLEPFINGKGYTDNGGQLMTWSITGAAIPASFFGGSLGGQTITAFIRSYGRKWDPTAGVDLGQGPAGQWVVDTNNFADSDTIEIKIDASVICGTPIGAVVTKKKPHGHN